MLLTLCCLLSLLALYIYVMAVGLSTLLASDLCMAAEVWGRLCRASDLSITPSAYIADDNLVCMV